MGIINLGHAEVIIGEDCKISPKANFNVTERLEIGDRSIINEGAWIEGRDIRLGRECFIHTNAWIGGGSAFEPSSRLVTGDFLHMGRNSHVNTARKVEIGHEVGLGGGTQVYTHGAYVSAYEGFPVQWGEVLLGDNVWIPNGIVMPNVVIGNNVVVAAMSLVNKNIPPDCFVAGIPAAVKGDARKPLTVEQKLFLLKRICADAGVEYKTVDHKSIELNDTIFKIPERQIEGTVCKDSRRLKEHLRRNGIRFRYKEKGGVYVHWNE